MHRADLVDARTHLSELVDKAQQHQHPHLAAAASKALKAVLQVLTAMEDAACHCGHLNSQHEHVTARHGAYRCLQCRACKNFRPFWAD